MELCSRFFFVTPAAISAVRLQKKEGRGIGSPFPLSYGSAEPYSLLPISLIKSEQRQA